MVEILNHKRLSLRIAKNDIHKYCDALTTRFKSLTSEALNHLTLEKYALHDLRIKREPASYT